MRVRLGVDIGGTKVNIGVLTEEGKLIKQHKFAIAVGMDCNALMAMTVGQSIKLLEQCGLTLDKRILYGNGVCRDRLIKPAALCCRRPIYIWLTHIAQMLLKRFVAYGPY